MKLNGYAFFLLMMLGLAFQDLSAQPIHKPYNPFWQWGRADSALSFGAPGATVLAVRNGKSLWGRMQRIKRVGSYNEPQGDWILGEFDSLGRQVLGINTYISGKVNLIDAKSDAAGNWYVLGRWYDTALFSVNAPYVRPNPGVNTDANHFMVRYDAGTLFPSWIQTIGPLATSTCRSFVVDNNRLLLAVDTIGGTIVRSMSTATGVPTRLFKQAGSGTTSSIQVDASGAIYLAGSCATNGMDFNGATEPPTTASHSYIVKYRSNGTHIWHRWFQDNSCHDRKLTLFNNNTLYYTGGMTESFTLGTLPLQPTTVSYDYVVARMDTAGTALWARQLPVGMNAGITLPGAAFHATVTPDSSLALFTQAAGWMDWGDTLFSNFQTVSAASIVSFGYDSRTRFVRDVYADVAINQHITSEGTAIWISGYARANSGTIAMDTMRTRTSNTRYSPFMARLRMIRPIPTTNPGVGVGEPMAGQLRAYPVPAETTLTIEGFSSETAISLIDVNGRRVIQDRSGGRERLVLDVARFPRGHYVLEMLEADGSRLVRRVTLR